MEFTKTDIPGLEVTAGGGVRGRADLDRLKACGVRNVLVASALHDGRLSRSEVTPFTSKQSV